MVYRQRVAEQRFDLRGRSLREHVARGSLINAAFLAGLTGLTFVRGFVLAALLTPEEYGIWGIVVVALGTIFWLKQIGIGDKYVQQDDEDQEAAFQRAFTLEVMAIAAFGLVALLAVPLVAAVYGRQELLLPGFALLLVLPAGVLQVPLWVHYRRMEFFRQRVLQSLDPIVALVVSVPLAVAGAGYWALLGGALAGAWATGIAAWRSSPYRLRLRYDVGTLRSYWSFSWPLAVTGGSGLVIAQCSLLFGEAVLGLAAAGAITLAASVSLFADRLDQIVTGALYPAICAVRDRTELLFESFVKSNRLALMWAMPFGLGLTLFSPDLVRFVLGEGRWALAVPLLQVFGATAAVNHLGFNWSAYFRARGETRPLAVASVATMLTFLLTAIPLLYAFGLEGFAAGIAAQTVTAVGVRSWYLARLFDARGLLRHAVRGIAPSVPAVGVVLLVRLAQDGERTGLAAGAELALYVMVTVVATALIERALLRETLAYVRGGVRPAVA